jgi:uncharacterized membrane protein
MMESPLHPVVEQLLICAQAAGDPPIDAALVARVVSRMLHILAAIILGGGLFYMRSILSPSGSDACFAGRRSAWAMWVGVSSLLLLASGLFNFLVILGQYREAGVKLPSTYHMLFGIKTLLALLVMFVAAILAGKTATAERFRANMGRWLNIGWTVVIAIVVLGALLRAHHLIGPPPAGSGEPRPAEASHG